VAKEEANVKEEASTRDKALAEQEREKKAWHDVLVDINIPTGKKTHVRLEGVDSQEKHVLSLYGRLRNAAESLVVASGRHRAAGKRLLSCQKELKDHQKNMQKEMQQESTWVITKSAQKLHEVQARIAAMLAEAEAAQAKEMDLQRLVAKEEANVKEEASARDKALAEQEREKKAWHEVLVCIYSQVH
jgi:hypothetical protein